MATFRTREPPALSFEQPNDLAHLHSTTVSRGAATISPSEIWFSRVDRRDLLAGGDVSVHVLIILDLLVSLSLFLSA